MLGRNGGGERGWRVPELPSGLYIAATTLIIAATYGIGVVTYDTSYALVWGQELMNGELPDFEAPQAPTPHPLSYVVGAALSLSGAAGPSVAVGIVMMSYAGLAWAAFCLGRNLLSWQVGAVFGLLLLTRPFLAAQALRTTLDIPFLALIVGAAALHTKDPTRPTRVLVVLALAGLLRPEAWLLAGVYWLLVARTGSRPDALRLLALVIAAPAVWMLLDAASTGDPFWSLNGTQDLAAALNRSRGVDQAIDRLPVLTELILTQEVLVVGLVGFVAALGVAWTAGLGIGVVAGIGIGWFFVLGIAELPLIPRYVELPAIAAVFAAAIAACGWTVLDPGLAVRRVWAVASVVALAILGISTVNTLRTHGAYSSYAGDRTFFPEMRKAQRDLVGIATAMPVEEALDACSTPVAVLNQRVVPIVAYATERSPRGFTTLGTPAAASAPSTVLARTTRVAGLFLAPGEEMPRLVPPAGSRRVAENDSWAWYVSC